MVCLHAPLLSRWEQCQVRLDEAVASLTRARRRMSRLLPLPGGEGLIGELQLNRVKQKLLNAMDVEDDETPDAEMGGGAGGAAMADALDRMHLMPSEEAPAPAERAGGEAYNSTVVQPLTPTHGQHAAPSPERQLHVHRDKRRGVALRDAFDASGSGDV